MPELPISDELKQRLEQIDAVVLLYKGTRFANNKKFYAYLSVPKERIPDIMEVLDAPSIDIEDYGTILHWDEKEDPPQEVQDYMTTHYGVIHDIDQRLQGAIERAMLSADQREDE